jgi:serine-type D-Ala-D-Ala carboxypeptidase
MNNKTQLNIEFKNVSNISIPYSILAETSSGTSSDYQEKFCKVDELIEKDIDNGFPGAALLIVKDGKIIKKTAYGYKRKYADGGKILEIPEKMETNTLFDIASNSKMYSTNYALMKLVHEGKLDVTAPVQKYISEYKGDGRDKVTIKNLLTHTAGYAPEIWFFLKDNGVGEEFYSFDREKTIDLLIKKAPFVYEAGSKTIYSDNDYILLGIVIEAITGMAQDEYVEKEIYLPLGLKNTIYNPLLKGRKKEEFAATEIFGTSRGQKRNYPGMRDYVLRGEVHDEKAYYSLGGVAGHAGLFSTIEDLAVLTQIMHNGGGYGNVELFSQDVIDLFCKPSDYDKNFGLGWRRAANGGFSSFFGVYASSLAVGHTGWTGTVTLIDPKYNLSIILLTNKKHTEFLNRDPYPLEKCKGDFMETGKYGSVLSLIYEALLEH